MRRLALVLTALAACSRPARPAVVPPPPPEPAHTCDDAAAHAADQFGADRDTVAQSCAEQAWPQGAIDCVVAADSAESGDACFDELVAAAPVCQTLGAIVEAGRDPSFSSIHGEPAYGEAHDFLSTITLTDADRCVLYVRDDHATVSCDMVRTSDEGVWNDVHQRALADVDACLARAGWTGEDRGRGNFQWTAPDDGLPTVHVEIFQMNSEGYVRVEIRNQQ